MIENETYADAYLTDLLKRPEFRSMAVVEERAEKYISDPQLKTYFISKAKAALASRP